MSNRLFIGVFPAGISYADRQREEHGDYANLAFLPYDTLKLEVYGGCPSELKAEIEAHAATIQSRVGEEYPVSSSQYVTLGNRRATKKNELAKAEPKIPVRFNSIWEEGLVATDAQLNLATGEVTDIAVSDEGAEFEHLLSETIEVGELTATVEADDDGNYFVVEQAELEALRGWVASSVQPRYTAG